MKGLVKRNTHVQYESPVSSSLKGMAKVKVFFKSRSKFKVKVTKFKNWGNISTSSTKFVFFRVDWKTKMAFLASDCWRVMRVQKTLALAIPFKAEVKGLSYCTCVFLVTRSFTWCFLSCYLSPPLSTVTFFFILLLNCETVRGKHFIFDMEIQLVKPFIMT